MSPRARTTLIIVAVLIVGGIVLTAMRDTDGSRQPVGVVDQPTSPSASLPPVTTTPLASTSTTTSTSTSTGGRGPIAAMCTANEDGSFAASFTSTWADGVVERGAETIMGSGLKTVTGDRGTVSYYFIKVVDGHPSCLDYN